MRPTLPRQENYAQRSLRETRGLRREREDRERAEAIRSQQQNINAQQQLTETRGRQVASESALDRQAQLNKQQLVGKQQSGLQRMRGEQAARQGRLSLQDASNARAFQAFTEGRLSPEQANVAGTYRPEFGYRFGDMGTAQLPPAKGRAGAKGGLPGPQDMLKMRNTLFQQFWGKGRGGNELRKKYGDDFDAYFAEQTAGFQQPAAQQGALPAAQSKPSHGTIEGSGGVLAASKGGVSVDPEQYAQSVLPKAPVQQQQFEQPTGRVQAKLPPSPQDVDFDPMTSEAFQPPQTLAEFKRKQRLKKGISVLPGQKRMQSLIEKIREERALSSGGKRYY